MTLRHLTIFLCVCDEGNMTAAGAKLYIAQPSVSQAIRELEKYYNVRLFERLGRKLFITLAGQKLITYARHIVHLSQEAEEAMAGTHHNGVIRIGASVTIGTCILNDIILEFNTHNPHAKIIAAVNNTKIIEGMLLLDELDIGLVEGKIHSPGIISLPFMNDELVLVTGIAHPFTKIDRVKLADIDDVEFIVREEGSGTRELFESVMASKGLNWEISGVYNNAETIKKFIAAGLGISVMSRLAVEKEVQRNELAIVEVEDVSFKRQFSIVHHKNKFIVPVLANFIQVCLNLGCSTYRE